MLSKSTQRRMAAQGNPVMKCKYCGKTVLLRTLHFCPTEGKTFRASSDSADFLTPVIVTMGEFENDMKGETWTEPAPDTVTPFAGDGGSFDGAGAEGSFSIDTGGSENGNGT